MTQKVTVENLFILNVSDSMKKAKENYYLSRAVTRVFQVIVDDDNRLVGILPEMNGDEKDEDPVSKYMISTFLKIKDDGDEVNLEQIAESLFRSEGVKDPYYLIPVVDKNDRLIYAFQQCNGSVCNYKNNANKRFSFESVIGLEIKLRKGNAERSVFICSNLGKAENSIEINEIKTLDKNAIVVIGFDEDYLAEEAASECLKNNIEFHAWVVMDKNLKITDYWRIDRAAGAAFNEIIQENGRYFDWLDFETIFQAIKQTESLEGDYVEIGTYRGDSAKAALEYMKQAGIKRSAYFLDTYEGFTYEGAHDSMDKLWDGSHTDTSIGMVRQRLSRYENAKCIKTDIIADEIPEEIKQIAVCNIDVDMYEAYKYALEKVNKRLAKGGVILAEDYGHTPALIGGQLAIMEFAESHKDEYMAIYGRGSQLWLIKK